MRPVARALALALGVLGALAPPPAGAAAGLPPIRHVFVIVLENESASSTFGPGSPAPYLAKTLTGEGAYGPNLANNPLLTQAAGLTSIIRNGRGRMPAVADTWTQAQIRALVAYAKSLAGNKKVRLPPGYAQDFETCRHFLDQHSR